MQTRQRMATTVLATWVLSWARSNVKEFLIKEEQPKKNTKEAEVQLEHHEHHHLWFMECELEEATAKLLNQKEIMQLQEVEIENLKYGNNLQEKMLNDAKLEIQRLKQAARSLMEQQISITPNGEVYHTHFACRFASCGKTYRRCQHCAYHEGGMLESDTNH